MVYYRILCLNQIGNLFVYDILLHQSLTYSCIDVFKRYITHFPVYTTVSNLITICDGHSIIKTKQHLFVTMCYQAIDNN